MKPKETTLGAKILVATGEKTKLAKKFKVSAPTIRIALSDKWSTKLHYDIRIEAIKRGGVELPLPNN